MIPIPADVMNYPPGCPDPIWCSGNRLCYWQCFLTGLEENDVDVEIARLANLAWLRTLKR